MTTARALILIDVQLGLDEPRLGERSNPDAERNMARLLREWRRRGLPIFHIQHMSTEPDSPLRPDLPGNAIKPVVAPLLEEPVIQKQVNCAFIGTDLSQQLQDGGIESLLIAGLTIEHCVSTTARLASDLGYDVLVAADATAAHESRSYQGVHLPAEIVHDVALANLQGEFASVQSAAQILAQLPDA